MLKKNLKIFKKMLNKNQIFHPQKSATKNFQQKKSENFFRQKKSVKKNLKKKISKKIKSIDFGVKHIQRRAPNSFSALRTSPIKIETIFGKLLETATQPIFKGLLRDLFLIIIIIFVAKK